MSATKHFAIITYSLPNGEYLFEEDIALDYLTDVLLKNDSRAATKILNQIESYKASQDLKKVKKPAKKKAKR